MTEPWHSPRFDWHPWWAWYPVRLSLVRPDDEIIPGPCRWLRWVETRLVATPPAPYDDPYGLGRAGDLTDGWWQYRDPLTISRLTAGGRLLIVGFLIVVVALAAAGYLLSGAWLGW